MRGLSRSNLKYMSQASAAWRGGGLNWPSLLANCRGVTSPCCSTSSDRSVELDTEQAGNATLIAAIGVRRGLPARAVSIALATAYQESKIGNLPAATATPSGSSRNAPRRAGAHRSRSATPTTRSTPSSTALRRSPTCQERRRGPQLPRQAAPGPDAGRATAHPDRRRPGGHQLPDADQRRDRRAGGTQGRPGLRRPRGDPQGTTGQPAALTAGRPMTATERPGRGARALLAALTAVTVSYIVWPQSGPVMRGRRPNSPSPASSASHVTSR